MFLIVGLGNPGLKYKNTRHNVGFDTVDFLADRYGIDFNEKKWKGLAGSGRIEGQRVVLLKPQTFMNLSGESVVEAVNFFKIDPTSELIIIYDDISLEPGQLRVRPKGSAGGHNGVKSIISSLGGEQKIIRVKVGVGEKPAGYDLADYVLGHFSKEDRETVNDAISRASKAVTQIICEGVDSAMNEFNRKA